MQVDLGHCHMLFEREPLGRGDQITVFCNHGMPAEHGIRGRFARACRYVHIRAHKTPRLMLDHFRAVFALARQLVAGRYVDKQRCTGHRLIPVRRKRHPKIFAKLNAKHKLWNLAAFKQNICAKRHGLPRKPNRLIRHIEPRRKPALLIILRIVGKIGLWNNAEQLSRLKHDGRVVELIVCKHRHPHNSEHA